MGRLDSAMFRKIISNLPFQPVLLAQLSAYIKQLHKDVSLRTISILLVLVILVAQVFIVLSPSKSTLTTDPADIVYGASSASDILQSYINNRDNYGHADIQNIYNYYGVGEQQIISSKEVEISQQNNSKYIMISRKPSNIADMFIATSNTVNQGVYEFPLSYWGNNNYKALTGVSNYGYRYWILLNGSGNIVYEKGAKSPSVELIKRVKYNPHPKPGETSIYSISLHNGGKAISENTNINSILPADIEYQNYTTNADVVFEQKGQQLSWKLNNTKSSLAPSDNWITIDVTVKANKISGSEQIACDSTTISSSNGPLIYAQDNNQYECINIRNISCPATGATIPTEGVEGCPVTCPDGSTTTYSLSCAKPQLTCESLQIARILAWDNKTYKTTLLRQPGSINPKISYYVNDNLAFTEQIKQDTNTSEFSYKFPSDGNYTIRAELSAPEGSLQPSQNCTINENITKSRSKQLVTTSVKVANLTKNLDNANNTYANKGDNLKYTISVKNLGDTTIENFDFRGQFADNIGDILEYANTLNISGGTYDNTTYGLSWDPVTIGPDAVVTKTFTVAIKNPSPSTPTSKSNPLSYDYVLSNTYGNTVNIKLHKPFTKTIEIFLINTPGVSNLLSLFVVAIILLIMVLIYIRDSILKREAEIIHKEYSSGGL